MKHLRYSIWDKEGQKVINCLNEDVYIRYDGKIGFINSVGEFTEIEDYVINEIIIF